jgi:hypothetical protein
VLAAFGMPIERGTPLRAQPEALPLGKRSIDCRAPDLRDLLT